MDFGGKGLNMKRERLEDLGRILERLTQIMDMDVFENLSKHDPYWDTVDPKDLISKHSYDDDILTVESVLTDRLDDCRMKFSMIHDAICECWTIARGDDE